MIKQGQGLRRLTSILKVLLLVTSSQISTEGYRRNVVHERKSQSMQQTSLLSYFKKSSQWSQISATTTLISHQHRDKTFHQKKHYDYWRHTWWLPIFSNSLFGYVHCFRHNAIAHSIDYNTANITFICIGKPKNQVTYFIFIFALLYWSGTKPAVYLRYTYI